MAREWLKQLRVEKHFTQAALARAADLKVARYSRIEAGYCDMRDEEAMALAHALEQPVEFIRSGQRDLGAKPPDAPAPRTRAKTPPAPAIPAAIPLAIPAVAAPKGLAAATASEPSKASTKGGDDLSDPVNFTLMPPTEALASGTLSPTEFRSRLQQHIAFATKVLHTSKVKPRIWVAWRDFNNEAQNQLRRGDPTAKSPPAASVIPVASRPAPVPGKAAPPTSGNRLASDSPRPARTRPRGNKNLFGYFVEVAKETLPADKIESLSALALAAKNQHPELGFMKHFKLIAETELPPADFEKIATEAARRDSSPTA